MRGKEWGRSLKAGDEVIVSVGGWSDRKVLCKVTKVSAQWGGTVYVDKRAFAVDGRGRTGSVYTRHYIHKPTAELRELAHRQLLLERLTAQDWAAIPTNVLSAVVAALETA